MASEDDSGALERGFAPACGLCGGRGSHCAYSPAKEAIVMIPCRCQPVPHVGPVDLDAAAKRAWDGAVEGVNLPTPEQIAAPVIEQTVAQLGREAWDKRSGK